MKAHTCGQKLAVFAHNTTSDFHGVKLVKVQQILEVDSAIHGRTRLDSQVGVLQTQSISNGLVAHKLAEIGREEDTTLTAGN